MRKVLGIAAIILFVSCFALVPAFAQEEKAPAGPPVGNKPGNMFPAFQLTDPVGGKTYGIKDLSKPGEDTVLLFMQTACTLCKTEIEMFQEKWEEIKDKVEVVLISVDFDAKRIKGYKEGYNIPFLILHDADAKVLQSAGYSSTPALVVLDPQGKVKQSITGYNAGEVKAYVRQVAKGK